MNKRDHRITELITHEAAQFIVREASGQSLITVTRTVLSKNADHAMIFVSIFPPQESKPALSFLSRIAGDFRAHLATRSRLHPLPKIEFVLDEGELYRQHLDEISKKL
ncbi:MAG: ribosome-binding factor A [bacterium]|nr:ribosome-binding factor A [bacterium]